MYKGRDRARERRNLKHGGARPNPIMTPTKSKYNPCIYIIGITTDHSFVFTVNINKGSLYLNLLIQNHVGLIEVAKKKQIYVRFKLVQQMCFVLNASTDWSLLKEQKRAVNTKLTHHLLSS